MFVLKNPQLTVEVDKRGAQLTHVFDNRTGFDYIWNGEAWPKHAPILFPSIGRSTDDCYLINDKAYEMPQHGFVADYDFDLLSQTENSLTLSFGGNDETFKYYPFHFELHVRYTLVENELLVSFEVKNFEDKDLSYSLGFHPAFNLEGAFEEAELSVRPERAQLYQHEIVKIPFPYRSGNIKPVLVEGSKFKLNRAMFAEGLVILENKIDFVSLKGVKHGVAMELHDFPNLCLWTKEDEELHYLCLEPFYGLPDEVNTLQELSLKEGNDRLEAHGTKAYRCRMTFE
ncbi:MAG: aldose 1-epimerase family protein [Streptococcaceae bacterium]|jgi:galactose mutarotase-like enzyme|nr:aldose 1-epimerase family protein [Streptococcaceae bacterium]